MKIRPVGAALYHADRRTDMTKLIAAFYNFAKAPNQQSTTRCLSPPNPSFRTVLSRCSCTHSV